MPVWLRNYTFNEIKAYHEKKNAEYDAKNKTITPSTDLNQIKIPFADKQVNQNTYVVKNRKS